MSRKRKITKKHVALLSVTATLGNIFPYTVLASTETATTLENVKAKMATPETDVLTYEELSKEQKETVDNIINTYETTNKDLPSKQKETLLKGYNLAVENLYLLFTEEFLIEDKSNIELLAANKKLQAETVKEFNDLVLRIKEEVKVVAPPVVEEPVKETPKPDVVKPTAPIKETPKPNKPAKEPVKEVIKEEVKPKPVEKAPVKVKEEATKPEKTIPKMSNDKNTQIESETVILDKNKDIVVEDKTDINLDNTYTKEASIEQALENTGSLYTTPSRKVFINQLAKSAIPIAEKHGIYPSVMLAQAILESNYGSSGLSRGPNFNLFGMKGTYRGNFVAMKTLEDTGSGLYYQITAKFRKYPSYKESLEDYAKLIINGIDGNRSIYHGTLIKNTDSFVDALNVLEGTYATDTRYASKLINIILSYNLTQFDEPEAMENILNNTTELTSVDFSSNDPESTFIVTLENEHDEEEFKRKFKFLLQQDELNLKFLTNLLEFSPVFSKDSQVESSKNLISNSQKHLVDSNTEVEDELNTILVKQEAVKKEAETVVDEKTVDVQKVVHEDVKTVTKKEDETDVDDGSRKSNAVPKVLEQ